jgi:hypothetical protein
VRQVSDGGPVLGTLYNNGRRHFLSTLSRHRGALCARVKWRLSTYQWRETRTCRRTVLDFGSQAAKLAELLRIREAAYDPSSFYMLCPRWSPLSGPLARECWPQIDSP